MKKIVLSLGAFVAMSGLVFAGGDIDPVEPVVGAPVVMGMDGSNFYVGLGVAAMSVNDSSVSSSFTSEKAGSDRLGNVSLLMGYNINQYIAVEGRYTTSFTDEDKVEMSGWSIFAKPQYPVGEGFSVYGLLGYGSVNVDGLKGSTIDVPHGAIADVNDKGFQWGIGASYDVNDNLSVFVDYTSLANNMDGIFYNGALEIDTAAITVGLTYSF